jgi:primary-amine oxidase
VEFLDQLSLDETRAATQLIRERLAGQDIKFNCLTLREPLKAEYLAFRQGEGPRPDQRAFAILIDRCTPGGVIEAVINLTSHIIEEWKHVEDVMPILTPTDLGFIERVAQSDPQVIQACRDIGIYDMSQVYFDAWAIRFNEHWGRDRRLQQGLPYYRHEPEDNQYTHPLDFIVIADTETEEILSVDVHTVDGERTHPPLKQQNYLPTSLQHGYPYNTLKPIHIT